MEKINTASWITIIRLILLPILIFVLLTNFINYSLGVSNLYIEFKYVIAGVIFILGSITDFLDGYIARKYDQITPLGKFLDPIADKLFVNSTLIILSSQGFISPLLVVVFIGRDTIVDVIRMITASKGEVVSASKFGKLKTVFQMVGISLMLMYNFPFVFFNIPADNICIYLALFFSIISGLEYYNLNKKHLF